jgi:hypothetical protein
MLRFTGWLRTSYIRLMAEDSSGQFTARGSGRGGRGQTVEDDPDGTYFEDGDDAAESGPEDIGFQPDDVATLQEDLGDSGTADLPLEPEEVG